jgi:hypothetical protein
MGPFRTLVYMTSLFNSFAKINSRRRAMALMDPNGDKATRLPSSDPRLDLAVTARH